MSGTRGGKAYVLIRPIIIALLVPPANLVVMAVVGLLLRSVVPGLGGIIAALALTLLLLLALPAVSKTLIALLETGLPITPPASTPPGAIVIIGAGVQCWSGDPRFDIDPLSLERLRTGAALYRRVPLPILVSGGILHADEPALANLLASSLKADFQVPTRWAETKSYDTWENAANSAAILQTTDIRSIWLVTHAWHMRRAIQAFTHFGITATAAPVGIDPAPAFGLSDFVPHASAWNMSYYALHEWIGCAYYALRVSGVARLYGGSG
jgi:uncharacterized SAM-binding protein YcdF (DUF218 family)